MGTTVIVVFMGDSGNLKIYKCIFDERKRTVKWTGKYYTNVNNVK